MSCWAVRSASSFASTTTTAAVPCSPSRLGRSPGAVGWDTHSSGSGTRSSARSARRARIRASTTAAAGALDRLEDYEKQYVGREMSSSTKPLQTAVKQVRAARERLAEAERQHAEYVDLGREAERREEVVRTAREALVAAETELSIQAGHRSRGAGAPAHGALPEGRRARAAGRGGGRSRDGRGGDRARRPRPPSPP